VQDTKWWREYTELAVLFFLHAMAMGMWFVPLGAVLDAHGLQDIKPLAFATSGISAFISPLIFGALADQRVAPVHLLRWLAVATALAMAAATTAIERDWGKFTILALIQLHSLFSTPTWSLSTTIVFARLSDAGREFGPLRAMATVGWMVGCFIISALGADRSTLAGYCGTLAWVAVLAFSFTLPAVAPPATKERLTWKQRLGLDALSLLKNRDHRVVFITAAIYNIPLCAFYPYTPANLREVGLEHTSAWMTLGQVTEVIAMFSLAGVLTRWRLKPVFLSAIAFGILRYGLCAFGGKFWLLAGITMHGFAYALFFITAQIYLEQRIEARWRARAQALLTLMLSGFGNTLGYLGCGWWFAASSAGTTTHWPLFWGGLSASVAVVFIVFAFAYKGRGSAGTENSASHLAG
jgi:nucleoside transporter